MKNLELKKIETGNKAAQFTYQVIEDGKVIAERKSNREYVACYVIKDKTKNDALTIAYCFSRMNLIGKGDSRYLAANEHRAYALATINTTAVSDSLATHTQGNTTNIESTEIEYDRLAKLLAQTKDVHCFEHEGLIFFAERVSAIKQFIKNNPQPADMNVWLQKNYEHYCLNR